MLTRIAKITTRDDLLIMNFENREEFLRLLEFVKRYGGYKVRYAQLCTTLTNIASEWLEELETVLKNLRYGYISSVELDMNDLKRRGEGQQLPAFQEKWLTLKQNDVNLSKSARLKKRLDDEEDEISFNIKVAG